VSDEAAIEVENLVREFRKGPRAVDGIDLAVQPGEIYGFLGPNGAGKSTTVLMLTTLLPPTSGRATVGGFDIVRQGAQVRATIGAALQEAALDAILTGREHLMLQATLQGLPGAERRRRTGELLARVGLTEAADRRVGGYSGGMKRRLDLALARADGSLRAFLARLNHLDVLVIDDWAMAPLVESERRDFWEIAEDRYQTRSMILTSQLPVSRWHEQIGDPTLADGILDRLVHNAHRIEMRGESMRKKPAEKGEK